MNFGPLFYPEIMRVSSIVHNHGFGDFDRHRFRSPSPMSSPNPRSNLPGNGFSPWSGLQEVTLKNVFSIKWLTLFCTSCTNECALPLGVLVVIIDRDEPRICLIMIF